MSKQKLPKSFLAEIQLVTNKRARLVLDLIVEHGFVTTEELQTKYGYNDPRRAPQDAKELGFPIETFKVKSSQNRSISAYRFGDVSGSGKIHASRKQFPKSFKKKLIEQFGSKCNICSGKFEERYLQIDHRVPFGVRGEVDGDLDLPDFQLLDGSCNRAKSWSCEHCENVQKIKDPAICQTCYWGSPENYAHVAMEDARRLDLLWQGKEVNDFDTLQDKAALQSIPLPEFVKIVLRQRGR